MPDFERKSDGRRILTTEFKRQWVELIRSGETTVAAFARELSVVPTLIRKWIKLSERGSAAAVDAGEDGLITRIDTAEIAGKPIGTLFHVSQPKRVPRQGESPVDPAHASADHRGNGRGAS